MDIIKFSAEIEEEYFSDLVIQIQKDFSLCGLDFEGIINSKKDLLSILFARVKYLNQHNVQGLMNLLYRIDVKQENIVIFAQKMKLSLEEAIVISILQRELQKVKFKKNTF